MKRLLIFLNLNLILLLSAPAAHAFDLWQSAGMGLGGPSSRPLSAAAAAYKNRVEADGGTVENIQMVDAIFRDAATNGYSTELIGWSVRWGAKVDALGRVSKLYSLAGATSDMTQATALQMPQKYAASANGGSTLIFPGRSTGGMIKTGAFTLNQPETAIFGMANLVKPRTNVNIIDGSTTNYMRIYVSNAATPTISMYAGGAGPNSNLLTAGLKTPLRLVYNGAGSSIKVGANAASTGNAGTQAAGAVTLGAAPGGTGNSFFHMSDLVILTSAVDGAYAAKVAAVESVLARYNSSLEVAAPALIFDGNSMTSGVGATTDYDYPAQIKRSLGNSVIWYNFGTPSRTIPTAITDAASASGLDTVLAGVTKKNIVIYWDGTNDLYADSSAGRGDAVFASFLTYVAARKSADPNCKVIALTMLPRSNSGTPAGFETQRQAFNTAMRADGTAHFDVLVDVAADARIGDAGDENDTTYYGDKVHMTGAGYGIIAEAVKTAIQSLL